MSKIVRTKESGDAWGTSIESEGGGGGIEALASFSPVVVHNIADAEFHTVDWTANAPAFGSGIALNVDGQTIDLDDGWYQISVMLTLASDASGRPRDFEFVLTGLLNDPPWQVYAQGGVIGNPGIVQTVTTPPIPFDASNQNSFAVDAYGESGGAETWSILATGGMRVWRLGTA